MLSAEPEHRASTLDHRELAHAAHEVCALEEQREVRAMGAAHLGPWALSQPGAASFALVRLWLREWGPTRPSQLLGCGLAVGGML